MTAQQVAKLQAVLDRTADALQRLRDGVEEDTGKPGCRNAEYLYLQVGYLLRSVGDLDAIITFIIDAPTKGGRP